MRKKKIRVVPEKTSFDETPNVEDIDGVRVKNFVKYSSKYFSDYFEYIHNNPTSAYDAYCNDLVIGEYEPSWVSVLEKDSFTLERSINEVIAGRILEFFDIPVVCEKIVKNEEYFPGGYSLLSLDFIGGNEEFETLENLSKRMRFFRTYKDLVLDVSEFIDNVYQKGQFGMSPNVKKDTLQHLKNKLVEDLCYSYLVRQLILNDWDYSYSNCGVLFNSKTNSFRMAPNFDVEQSMSGWSWSCDMLFVEDVFYNLPNVRDKFISKLNTFAKMREDGSYNYEQILSAKVEGEVVSLDTTSVHVLEESVRLALKYVEAYNYNREIETS